MRFAPSLVGAMLDALPYCLDYPYGCTEQTMSRFLPAVLTLKTLRNMGIDLADVKEIRRGKMEEIRRIEQGEGYQIWHQHWASPDLRRRGAGEDHRQGPVAHRRHAARRRRLGLVDARRVQPVPDLATCSTRS